MLTVISIAGFDPSAGAGVLADIKTFAAHGCYGLAAVTSLTSQNTLGVYSAYTQSPEILKAQVEPLIQDFEIAAVKIGMLPTREAVETVAEIIERYQLPNVVLDPVIRSSSGYDLIDLAALEALIKRLLPMTNVVTPNLFEAEILAGIEVKDLNGMRQAAQRIYHSSWQSQDLARTDTRRAVLIKGGHLQGEASDLLYDGAEDRILSAPKVVTRGTHGTGCALSSAIAARLAHGDSIWQAVQSAKAYLIEALQTAPGLGHGAGPLNHLGRTLSKP